MRGVFQATIVDSVGAVIPNANIEVRDEVSGDLVQVYEEFEAGDALGNPFTADEEGFTRFYLEDGLYKVRAYSGVVERIWRHVHIGLGTLIESGSFTATLTGMTAVVTRTMHWNRIGTLVTLYASGALGTSNSAAFTITGLPAELRPINRVRIHAASLVDNFVDVIGVVNINAGSDTLTFSRIDADGLLAGWETSGDKGFQDGFQLMYDIGSVELA